MGSSGRKKLRKCFICGKDGYHMNETKGDKWICIKHHMKDREYVEKGLRECGNHIHCDYCDYYSLPGKVCSLGRAIKKPTNKRGD